MTAVSWTCPALDRVAAIVAAHVPEPDRTAALLELEGLRAAHVQLRCLAADAGPRAAERADREVGRIEALMVALAAGRTT